MAPEEVKIFLQEYLVRNSRQRFTQPAELSDDYDLLLSGAIDSLGLLDLISAIQEHCKCELDFEGMDPEQITVVGPLCQYVSRQLDLA